MSSDFIAAILTPVELSSIDAVIKRMVALRAALPARDGVGWFNQLYLEMTRTVRRALSRGAFEDYEFRDLARIGAAS
ncbi:MAG: DUF5995 family protein [Actinomycetota bacterium]